MGKSVFGFDGEGEFDWKEFSFGEYEEFNVPTCKTEWIVFFC